MTPSKVGFGIPNPPKNIKQWLPFRNAGSSSEASGLLSSDELLANSKASQSLLGTAVDLCVQSLEQGSCNVKGKD